MLKRQATAAFLLPDGSLSVLNPLEYAVPRHLRFCTILVQISPLDSALTDGPPVTPLEYAVTETGGGGLPELLRCASNPVHGNPAEQFGIEVRRLLRHHLPGRGDLHDLFYVARI